MTESGERSPALVAAARNLRVDATTAEVTQRLAAAGIPSILLKGPSTARWLFEPSEARAYCDSDVLVPAPLEAAERVLAECGFERQRPLEAYPWQPHAMSWVRRGASVDLHRSFHGVAADDETVWRVLSAHTESMEVGGATVTVLAPAARTVVMALHAAADSAGRTKADLERALERLPRDLWREAAELAAALGASAPFAVGLRSTPLGCQVANALGLPDAESAWWILKSTGEAASRGSALRLEWLATMPSTRQKVRFAVRSLLPPPDVIRYWLAHHPEHRQSVALGYVYRLALAAKTAPRALREWRRSRAAVRG